MAETVSAMTIARHVGLSRTTVSLVLNGRGTELGIKPATQERIFAAAKRLGYRPNRAAQLMRGVKSGLIGLLQLGGVSLFHGMRSASLTAAIRQAGYSPLMGNVLNAVGVSRPTMQADLASACSVMIDARVEGVVMAGFPPWGDQEQVKRFQSAGIPLVNMDGIRLAGVPYVGMDYAQGMRDLTRHLLRLGRKRLIMIAAWQDISPIDAWPVLGRVRGFVEAITEAHGRVDGSVPRGLGPLVDAADAAGPHGRLFNAISMATEASNPFEAARMAVKAILDRGEPFDALACSNDDWALGAIGALKDAGIDCPRDVSVTGFDDVTSSAYLQTPLTSVSYPMSDAAEKAMHLVQQQIQGASVSDLPKKTIFPCELVVRHSCGANLNVPCQGGQNRGSR